MVLHMFLLDLFDLCRTYDSQDGSGLPDGFFRKALLGSRACGNAVLLVKHAVSLKQLIDFLF